MKGNRFLSIKLLFWLCLVVLFTVQLSVATVEQAPGIEWQKCLGGSSFDYGFSIKQTSDVAISLSEAPIQSTEM